MRMKPPGTGLQGEAPLRKLATMIVVAGLLAAPSGLAANGTITKGYGGNGANVQAVLGAKAAP